MSKKKSKLYAIVQNILKITFVSLIDASYVYEQQLSFSLCYFSKSLFVLLL